jgi:hypothetical protein
MSGPQQADVEDLIVEGDLQLRSESGAAAWIRVKVGRPRHLSDVAEDDWFCPVWIEGVGDGVNCLAGAGPVDSLMNAMDWVRSRCRELEHSRR